MSSPRQVDHAAPPSSTRKALSPAPSLRADGFRKAARSSPRRPEAKKQGVSVHVRSRQGAKVCRFIETAAAHQRQVGGAKAKIKLQPWQCFLIVVVRMAAKEERQAPIPRSLLRDPEKNREVHRSRPASGFTCCSLTESSAPKSTGATTEKQALEVWPGEVDAGTQPETCGAARGDGEREDADGSMNGSKFEPVIGNPGDGASPKLRHRGRVPRARHAGLYDTMETGMGAREQPLMLVITTAGTNIAGPCHEKHDPKSARCSKAR
jgi:hypothetical protein